MDAQGKKVHLAGPLDGEQIIRGHGHEGALTGPRSADVLILGAGPAGCTAALNLARDWRVIVVERNAKPRLRPGESLPPAANPLLRDMGLLDSFRQQGHLPCFGNAYQWGSPEWRETDFLRDPNGHGWHLDRPRFEAWLRQHAQARGAMFLTPAMPNHIEQHEGGWSVQVRADGGADASARSMINIQARIIVDAGGRTPVFSRAQGAARRHHDRLVCGWLMIGATLPEGPASMVGAGVGLAREDLAKGAWCGLTRILATEHGWWYNAALPDQRRMLAFYGDSDLHPARAMRHASDLLRLASEHVPTWLAELPPAWLRDGSGCWVHGYCAANSATTQPPAGDGWLCAGDAAMSFDPLSSQGIFNALYTGLAAAENIDRHLRGDAPDFSQYSAQLRRIDAAYHQHLTHWYGVERRWSDSPFWRRRHPEPGQRGADGARRADVGRVYPWIIRADRDGPFMED